MNNREKQNYRPKVHFTPPTMWTNDPNGMVYVDGVYHLFYQHYPDKPNWGPMHWGHAISRDLISWEHLPIALYPDELGMAFSGSCVYDVNNTSGLGTKDKPPMVAIYTSHHRLTAVEHQSIAYSTDFVHFEKSYANPVLHNPGIKDFRDPKVFWNTVLDCWSMVLAVNDRVNFYCSKDLKEWDKTGEFVIGGNGLYGICECPDCFPVETEDGTKWILIISMIIDTEDPAQKRHKTQYFIGDFDGNTFLETENEKEPLWLNYGTDHYAAVTFQNMDQPVLIGWANNWFYASEVPTDGYCGQMSIPTQVLLKKTPVGYRAAFQPLGLEKRKEELSIIKDQDKLISQTFGVIVTGNGPGKVTLFNTLGEELVVRMTEEDITVDRTKADQKSFSERYGLPEFNSVTVKRYHKGDYRMEIIFDVSILEVFAEDGLIPITMSVYPERPYEFIGLEGEIKAELYMI